MALTLPTIAPVGYALDYSDFLKTKSGKDGRTTIITGTVTVPSGTVSGTLIGLFPFNKGFKLASQASIVAVTAMGASVTLALGYQYYDSATGSSNTAIYAAASSTAAAGGVIPMQVTAGLILDAAGDGWVTALTGGATTSGSSTITYNMLFNYDISGVTN